MTATPHAPRADQRIRESGMFLQETVRTFHSTGAVAPSGPALARALSRHISGRDPADAPLTILEAGSGTGSVTRAIARAMRPNDTVDLAEPNPRFHAHLAESLERDPELSRIADRATLHRCLVTELNPTPRYDVIVSGLPFANFDAEEVREILDFYLSALRPGGWLSFFAYIGTQHIKAVMAPRESYLRQARTGWVVNEAVQRFGAGTDTAWANLPPARVHHLRKPVE